MATKQWILQAVIRIDDGELGDVLAGLTDERMTELEVKDLIRRGIVRERIEETGNDEHLLQVERKVPLT